MKSNSNTRRLAWSYSNSPSLEDFINKKLGNNKNQRPIFIKKNKDNENTTN